MRRLLAAVIVGTALGAVIAGQGPAVGLRAGDDFCGDVSPEGNCGDALANDAVFGLRALDPFSFEFLSDTGGFVEANISAAGVDLFVRPHPPFAVQYRICSVEVAGSRSCDTATVWLTVDPSGGLPSLGPWVSVTPTRDAPILLDQATLSGDVYVFIDDGLPPDAVRSVRFLVDGAQVQVERFVPYDLAGGTAVANPFDTTRLPDGPHTLTAEFTFAPSVGGHVERMDTAMTVDNSRTDHGFVLGLSGSPDRTSAKFLDGASVGDEVIVFLGRLPLIPNGGPVPAPGDGIDDVRFLLDGVLVQTERFAPYDMGGGTVDEARPFDLSALVPGSTHQLEARVRRSDGSRVPVTATFEKDSIGFTLTTVDSGGVGSPQYSSARRTVSPVLPGVGLLVAGRRSCVT